MSLAPSPQPEAKPAVRPDHLGAVLDEVAARWDTIDASKLHGPVAVPSPEEMARDLHRYRALVGQIEGILAGAPSAADATYRIALALSTSGLSDTPDPADPPEETVALTPEGERELLRGCLSAANCELRAMAARAGEVEACLRALAERCAIASGGGQGG